MLRTLELTNFKCFAQQQIDFGAVTLLAGQNGMGKSTVLQSLLLLKQSDALVERLRADAARNVTTNVNQISLTGPFGSLVLNGSYLSCGTARVVLYEGATADEIRVKLTWEGTDSLNVTFQLRDNPASDTIGAYFADFCGVLGHPLAGLSHYLAAERVGPRMSHSVSSYHVDERLDVGHDGAYSVAFLETHAGQSVLPEMCRTDAPATTLAEQTSAWMSEISPGIRLHTQQVPEVNAAALAVSFAAGRAVSGRYRPTSVGFGVSYALPVVVTLLAARKDSLVLIENPEAHLHPRGQMALGELMARAASAGVQVIAETHSDHVVNGIRLAVKEQTIGPELVRFHYFTRRDEGDRLVHQVESPTIDGDGRLDRWPDGFFDQWDVALERLL